MFISSRRTTHVRGPIELICSLLITASPIAAVPSASAVPIYFQTDHPSPFWQIAQADQIRKSEANEADRLWELGITQFEASQFQSALQSFQQALLLYRQLQDRRSEGLPLAGIGDIYTALGDYSKAIEAYQQSLVIAQEVENLSLEREILFGLANCYEAMGNVEQVVQLYDRLLPFLLENSDRYYGRALHRLGAFLLQAGRPEEAERRLTAGIERMERDLEDFFTGLPSTEAAYIRDRYLAPYQALQQALIAQNKPEAALAIAERSRARAFVALLAQQLATSEAAQASVSSLSLAPPPSLEQIRQIARQQNATLVEYSLIPKWNKISAKWQLQDAELFIWVIAPTGKIEFRSVDLSSLQPSLSSLAALVASSREALGVRGRNFAFQENPELVARANPNSQTAGITPQLQQLYQLLIQPIDSLLPTDPLARVIFIPYDSLLLTPFAALQDESGKYLIEKHTLVTTPSIQVLDFTRQAEARLKRQVTSNSAAEQVLIVGNPTMPSLSINEQPAQPLASLPGAEQEAKTIAALFNTQPLVGNQATKPAVIQRMTTARLIHLATHGLLDDFSDTGIPGAIALAPSSNDSGFLSAGEILNLKLQAELVVLSACDTGQGAITGDGVIGLSRAFIAAGTPSVIVSLWSIPDAPTATLMTEFYQNLKQTPDKAQALRQAMLQTMKRYPNPKDWAAFVLIGESQ